MQSRPDLDLSLPRYTIRYLDPVLGWQESKWKTTIHYAYKQYAMIEWDPVWDSEEYFTQDMVVGADPNSTGRFIPPKE